MLLSNVAVNAKAAAPGPDWLLHAALVPDEFIGVIDYMLKEIIDGRAPFVTSLTDTLLAWLPRKVEETGRSDPGDRALNEVCGIGLRNCCWKITSAAVSVKIKNTLSQRLFSAHMGFVAGRNF